MAVERDTQTAAQQKTEQSPFVIPENENPIEYGAGVLRNRVSKLVTEDLSEAFPENYVYQRGSYNRVFHTIESYDVKYGFSGSDLMISFGPDGKFVKGVVEHNVSNWSNFWEFDKAQLFLASDIDVIKYAPALVRQLIFDLADNLDYDFSVGRQIDNSRIEQVLPVLERRNEILKDIKGISKTSLKSSGLKEKIDTSGPLYYAGGNSETNEKYGEIIKKAKARLSIKY